MMDFSSVKRIVIKVGTSTLAHNTGNLNIRRVSKLIEVMSDLKNSGKDVIFVTSGAQGVGAAKAGLHSKPKEMPKKQACAAIGQCELMHIYDREFANYNHTVAQVLLTRDVISNKTRKENVINTFNTLLDMGIVPIINANDTVSIQELDFDEIIPVSARNGNNVDDLLSVIFDELPEGPMYYDEDTVTDMPMLMAYTIRTLNFPAQS